NREIFWYFEYSRLYCLIPFVAALLLSYITPMIWIARTHQSWIPQFATANGLILFMLGALLIIVITIEFYSPRGPYHLASVKTNGHVYYLGVLEYDSGDPAYAIQLYECDRYGLLCTVVCEYPTAYKRWREHFGLRADAQAQTISVILDNEPICTQAAF
ncbi:MAG: hypothetical protein HY866_00915, partial [Chloroflexi bacterium]|nr:hypothetical protein [Chloroflexota bacterium]